MTSTAVRLLRPPLSVFRAAAARDRFRTFPSEAFTSRGTQFAGKITPSVQSGVVLTDAKLQQFVQSSGPKFLVASSVFVARARAARVSSNSMPGCQALPLGLHRTGGGGTRRNRDAGCKQPCSPPSRQKNSTRQNIYQWIVLAVQSNYYSFWRVIEILKRNPRSRYRALMIAEL